MILRARTVLTMDGPPIENGAVAISGNQIVELGKFPKVSARHPGAKIIDLGEQALLPGLINAHCHLDYTCLRGKIPPQKTFTDWIRAINALKAELSPKDYLASIDEGFAEAKRFGTTTIANLTAFPDLVPRIHAPIRTWWFAELIDVRAPERAAEIIELAIQSLGRTRPPGAPGGLAPHTLFTASKNLYRRCEKVARREKILLTTHLAESREEMEMFRQESGPLYNFMKSIGRPMDDCGNETPLAHFLRVRDSSTTLRSARNDKKTNGDGQEWIVAHLNELEESDFDLLERSERRLHIVHSPRSHDYFEHSPFPFKKLRALGFKICLGTDSLASNQSLSLFDEMRAFQCRERGTSPDEILEMVTVNAARALHQDNALGRIRAGFRADLIAVPRSGDGNIFEQIVAFDGPVDWMLLNGKQKRNPSAPANVHR